MPLNHENAAIRADRETMWTPEPRTFRRSTGRPFLDEHSLWSEPLNATTITIGDVDIAVVPNHDPNGKLELARSRPSRTPGSLQGARRVEHSDLRTRHVRDIEPAATIESDAGWSKERVRHRPDVEEGARHIKALDSAIERIGYVESPSIVCRNADGKVEVTRGRAAVTPLLNEGRRRWATRPNRFLIAACPQEWQSSHHEHEKPRAMISSKWAPIHPGWHR